MYVYTVSLLTYTCSSVVLCLSIQQCVVLSASLFTSLHMLLLLLVTLLFMFSVSVTASAMAYRSSLCGVVCYVVYTTNSTLCYKEATVLRLRTVCITPTTNNKRTHPLYHYSSLHLYLLISSSVSTHCISLPYCIYSQSSLHQCVLHWATRSGARWSAYSMGATSIISVCSSVSCCHSLSLFISLHVHARSYYPSYSSSHVYSQCLLYFSTLLSTGIIPIAQALRSSMLCCGMCGTHTSVGLTLLCISVCTTLYHSSYQHPLYISHHLFQYVYSSSVSISASTVSYIEQGGHVVCCASAVCMLYVVSLLAYCSSTCCTVCYCVIVCTG